VLWPGFLKFDHPDQKPGSATGASGGGVKLRGKMEG